MNFDMKSAFATLPNVIPTTTVEGDAGLVAGLSTGFFAINEDALVEAGCPIPEVPAFLMQAEAMIPMAEMMLANMNQGVVPEAFVTLKSFTHEIEIIAAVIMGPLDNQFCTGSVLAFEYKKLITALFSELFAEFTGSETLLQ
jgi:hypothetical protein